jgi:hypothetical protein
LAKPGVPTQDYYVEGCILAPHVADVATINDLMLGDNDLTIVEYLPADSIEKDHKEDTDLMPPEILHLQNPSNFPPHWLRLKVGVPMILLRKLDPRNGFGKGRGCSLSIVGNGSFKREFFAKRIRARWYFCRAWISSLGKVSVFHSPCAGVNSRRPLRFQ